MPFIQLVPLMIIQYGIGPSFEILAVWSAFRFDGAPLATANTRAFHLASGCWKRGQTHFSIRVHFNCGPRASRRASRTPPLPRISFAAARAPEPAARSDKRRVG